MEFMECITRPKHSCQMTMHNSIIEDTCKCDIIHHGRICKYSNLFQYGMLCCGNQTYAFIFFFCHIGLSRCVNIRARNVPAIVNLYNQNIEEKRIVSNWFLWYIVLILIQYIHRVVCILVLRIKEKVFSVPFFFFFIIILCINIDKNCLFLHFDINIFLNEKNMSFSFYFI